MSFVSDLENEIIPDKKYTLNEMVDYVKNKDPKTVFGFLKTHLPDLPTLDKSRKIQWEYMNEERWYKFLCLLHQYNSFLPFTRNKKIHPVSDVKTNDYYSFNDVLPGLTAKNFVELMTDLTGNSTIYTQWEEWRNEQKKLKNVNEFNLKNSGFSIGKSRTFYTTTDVKNEQPENEKNKSDDLLKRKEKEIEELKKKLEEELILKERKEKEEKEKEKLERERKEKEKEMKKLYFDKKEMDIKEVKKAMVKILTQLERKEKDVNKFYDLMLKSSSSLKSELKGKFLKTALNWKQINENKDAEDTEKILELTNEYLEYNDEELSEVFTALLLNVDHYIKEEIKEIESKEVKEELSKLLIFTKSQTDLVSKGQLVEEVPPLGF